MDLNKLKNDVNKKQKKIEKKAFKLFCEDQIMYYINMLNKSREGYDKSLANFNNLTEEKLLEEYNNICSNSMRTYKSIYIDKVKENK